MELLGIEYPEDEDFQKLEEYRKVYQNNFIRDERGNIGYEISIPGDSDFVNVEFFVEESIAMILQHAKKLAKNQNSGSISDITITVPSYFTMNQRQMMLDAANLAGFTVLNLVHENTAAGLMYGIDTKNLEFPHKILIINMGASNLELSVVKYDRVFSGNSSSTTNDKGTLSIDVLDEQAVPGLGGYAFDYELVKIIAEQFDKKPERQGKESVLETPKIYRRLMKEVSKYKEILSANKEVHIRIVEIADGITLEFTLQRTEFEERIKPIIERSRPAFQKILEKHQIAEFNEVEIIGGGLRVPIVKDYFSTLLNNKILSTHLNPDEAMAFGSAYIAANYSSSYQVQKVYLYQKVPFDVYLNLTQSDG